MNQPLMPINDSNKPATSASATRVFVPGRGGTAAAFSVRPMTMPIVTRDSAVHALFAHIVTVTQTKIPRAAFTGFTDMTVTIVNSASHTEMGEGILGTAASISYGTIVTKDEQTT